MTDTEITLEPEGLEAARLAVGAVEGAALFNQIQSAIRAYLSRSTLPREGQPTEMSAEAKRIIAEYGRSDPVNSLAMVLFEAWCKADPSSGPAQHPASYLATFADMARAALPLEGQGEVVEPDWYMDPDDRICLRPSEVTPDDNWVPLYAAPLSPSPAVRDGVEPPKHLSPLPWRYMRDERGPHSRDWIEDAIGSIVVENVGHIDGPFIVEAANRALSTQEQGNG